MKKYITIKVGYTVGQVGCTGEYFNTIIINGDDVTNVAHYGMYGSDYRVNKTLEDKGYKSQYISSDYGRMTKKDILDIFISEYEAIEYIKNNIK